MTTDAWFPPADEYWVDASESDQHPLRYGDMCAAPDLEECRTAKGKSWAHVLVLHPSCELGVKAASDTEVIVARVNRVADIGASQRGAVRLGWAERNGQILVAHANTFWMPPLPTQDDDTDFYADFRRLQRVPFAALRDLREAAMTHDTRVYLIRRELYFKYRWLVDLDNVRMLETERIAGDPNFAGPRPDWAMP